MRRRVVMRRLPSQDALRRLVYRVRGMHMPAEAVNDVCVVVAPATDTPWFNLLLPPCPDCAGRIAWAEAGLVPGARECVSCGSRFTVATEDVDGCEECGEPFDHAEGCPSIARERLGEVVAEIRNALQPVRTFIEIRPGTRASPTRRSTTPEKGSPARSRRSTGW